MKSTIIRRLVATCLLLLAAHGLRAEVAVICQPGVSIDSIDADTIQAFYLNKKRQWPDGTGVELSLNDSPSIHKAFLDAYVGKSGSSYRSYWKRIVFTGKGAMPTTFADDAAVVAHVARTPGAIGYVDAANIGEGVKRLEVRP